MRNVSGVQSPELPVNKRTLPRKRGSIRQALIMELRTKGGALWWLNRAMLGYSIKEYPGGATSI